MKTDHPIMLYLRSRLNRALLICAIAVGLGGAVFLGPMGRLLVPLAAIVGYLGATVGILQSRRGASAILEEGDEDRTKAAVAAIRASEAERERIAVLRIADQGVRKAVEFFLQVSGEYLEACRRLSTYSPQGSDRIRDVLALLQIYLERLDGASTDEEYALQEKGAVQSSRAGNAQETVSRIREAAAFIRERMASDLAVLAAQDRLELMDEMEGKK
jgi:hypothetical protein